MPSSWTFLNEPVCSSVDSGVYCHSNQRGLKDRVFKNVFLLLEAPFLHSKQRHNDHIEPTLMTTWQHVIRLLNGVI